MKNEILTLVLHVVFNFACIFLGLILGIPFMSIGLISSIFWNLKNKSKLKNSKSKKFKEIERKTTELDTGIEYDYFETKPLKNSETLLFLHGFPDSASSWRYLMSSMSQNGYHCLAPNQRGYGQTSKPLEIEDYHVDHLVGMVLSNTLSLV